MVSPLTHTPVLGSSWHFRVDKIQLQTKYSGLEVSSLLCLEGSHLLDGVMVGVFSLFILFSKAARSKRTSLTTLSVCVWTHE